MLVRTSVVLSPAHTSLIEACGQKWEPAHKKEYSECAVVHGMLGLGLGKGQTLPKTIRTQSTLRFGSVCKAEQGLPFRAASSDQVAKDDIPCIQCGGRGGRRVCGASSHGLFAHIRCAACMARGSCVLCAYADSVLVPSKGDPFNTPVLRALIDLTMASGIGTHVFVMANYDIVQNMIVGLFVKAGLAVWRYESCPEGRDSSVYADTDTDTGTDVDMATDAVAKCLEWTMTRKQALEKGPAVIVGPVLATVPPEIAGRLHQIVVVSAARARPPACIQALLRALAKAGRKDMPVSWIATPRM